MDKIKVKQATTKGYIEMNLPGCCDLSYPTSKVRRGRVQGGADKHNEYLCYGRLQDYTMATLKRVGQASVAGSQAGMVYHVTGIAPTICACTHGYAIGYVLREYE